MRQIKFRGKRIDNGEWVYGQFSTIQDIEHYVLVPSALGRLWVEVNPETIGQFTGLKDKNGVDIYEGDCICDSIGCYKVFYHEKHCAFKLRYGKGIFNFGNNDLSNFHVEGNIHDKINADEK